MDGVQKRIPLLMYITIHYTNVYILSCFLDILFGVPMRESGIHRYSFRNRQRVITYAITIMIKNYDHKYVSNRFVHPSCWIVKCTLSCFRYTSALKKKLHEMYPLSTSTNDSFIDYIVHVHNKEFNYFVEYTPLMVTYILLFLYLYFSVRMYHLHSSFINISFQSIWSFCIYYTVVLDGLIIIIFYIAILFQQCQN